MSSIFSEAFIYIKISFAGEYMKIRAVNARSFVLLLLDIKKVNILNEEILNEDIAKAVKVFVDGSLSKSTGNILNVDGGVAVAFVR